MALLDFFKNLDRTVLTRLAFWKYPRQWLLYSIIGFGLVLFSTALYLKPGQLDTFNYAISTTIEDQHTEVSLFQWVTKGQPVPMLQQNAYCRSSVGINENTKDSDSVYEHMLPCLKSIALRIPPDDPFQVPLHILGVDGVRTLAIKNAKLAGTVLQNLFHRFLDFEFLTTKKLNIHYPKTLTGVDQARYTWLTLNYVEQLLNKEVGILDTGDTLGVLILGGSGAQMAYKVSAPNSNAAIEMSKKMYNLKVRSESCFGASEIVKRYMAFIIKTLQNSSSANIPDPCSNTGSVRQVRGSDILDNVCVDTVDVNITTYIKKDTYYLFKGKYEPGTCALVISTLLDPSKCKTVFKYCSDNDKDLPPNGMKFYATGLFYNVTRVLPGLSDTKDTISNVDYIKQTNEFCNLSWSSVVNANPNIDSSTCFLLFYVESQISRMYNFRATDWSNIIFENRLLEQNIDVTLGYILQESNSFPNFINVPTLGTWTFFLLFVFGASLAGYGIYMGTEDQKRQAANSEQYEIL